MAANPAPEPDGESLHIVAEEMRHREQVQDAQIQILATKATYLFTAGTASVGAAGAYLGLVADDVEIGFGFDFIALSVTGLSYVFLCVCFSSAYFVRDFVRAPDPEELMKYLHMPPSQSLEDVADSRRSALGKNDIKLEQQADWVNRELFTVILIIVGLGLALVGLSLD
jgi:hypothetical protein